MTRAEIEAKLTDAVLERAYDAWDQEWSAVEGFKEMRAVIVDAICETTKGETDGVQAGQGRTEGS